MAGDFWTKERQRELDVGYAQIRARREYWLPRLERIYREKVADDRSWFLWGVETKFLQELELERLRQEGALKLQTATQTGAIEQIERKATLETEAESAKRERFKTRVGQPLVEAYPKQFHVTPESLQELQE